MSTSASRPPRLGLPLLTLCLLAGSCSAPGEGLVAGADVRAAAALLAPTTSAPVCSFEIVAEHPHDEGAFTQGLCFREGQLYEGTGRHGQSSLRRVELSTGEVLQRYDLAEEFFGEGITVVGDLIYQLTWLEQVGFVYERASFLPLRSFTYTGPGWGLADDGRMLVMSDGSAFLSFRDPGTFDERVRVEVRDGEAPVAYLNELEWVRGELWANVYPGDLVARIEPDSGRVIAWLDLGGLLDPRPPTANVLNGIAFDRDGGRLFVTGKLWPTLYEIEVVGEPSFPLFRDGFAGGDLGAWSAVVGEH